MRKRNKTLNATNPKRNKPVDSGIGRQAASKGAGSGGPFKGSEGLVGGSAPLEHTRAKGIITETNRMQFVLSGMHTRTSGPYLAAINRILISLMADAEAPRDGPLWRVNAAEFNRRFRHAACAALVREKHGREMGCAMAAMLEASRPFETQVVLRLHVRMHACLWDDFLSVFLMAVHMHRDLEYMGVA
jgi:hypothetical protein